VKKYAGVYPLVESLSSDDEWWHVAPGSVGTSIPMNDPLGILTQLQDETKIIARLADPDTTVPTYDALAARVLFDQWGEVTVEIAAMSAWGTWGTGTVQFKNNAGTNDGSPKTVENRYPDEFPVETSVCCDMNFDPPRVKAGSCSVVP
jgi:hypothetical protein